MLFRKVLKTRFLQTRHGLPLSPVLTSKQVERFFRQNRNKLNMLNLFRLCRKDETSFDIVAVLGNKVECCFHIVDSVDGALFYCIKLPDYSINLCIKIHDRNGCIPTCRREQDIIATAVTECVTVELLLMMSPIAEWSRISPTILLPLPTVSLTRFTSKVGEMIV